MDINYWYRRTWLVGISFDHLIEKIIYYFSGSLAISYAIAMGCRVLAIVAPNDKVKFRDRNICSKRFLKTYKLASVLLDCSEVSERYGSRRR